MTAHSISERQMVIRVLGQSLGDFRSQPPVLAITCGVCQDTCELQFALLCERNGPDLLLGNIMLQLRCRRRRAHASSVRLLRQPALKPERGLRLLGS